MRLDTFAHNLTRATGETYWARQVLGETHLLAVEALAAAMHAHDPYTHDHCRRVVRIASVLARELEMPAEDRCALETAALLHDIGKIAVPDTILRKTAPLTDDESYAIRAHPEIGFKMLTGFRFLADALPALRYHHERLDGTGYPNGLAAGEIPLLARVLAVADAYDAVTTDRPYRSGSPASHGLAEISRCSGTHFDPVVVDALLRAHVRSAQ